MPILGILASSTVTAAGDYESIATVTVGAGGSASVTFSSIGTDWTHLQIRYMSRNEAANDELRMTFNSDSGNNYAKHFLRGSGSAATSVAVTSASNIEFPFSSYLGTTSNVFSAGVMDILDYRNTNKYKTVRGLGGVDLNGSGFIVFVSGLWQSTSAITSIQIQAGSGDIQEYSHFALYGIKSA